MQRCWWGCSSFLLLFTPVTCRWSQRFIVAAMLCPCTAASYYILTHTPKDTKSHARYLLVWSFFWTGFVCRALSYSCRFRSVIRICSQYYTQPSYMYTFDLWRKHALGESSATKKLTQLASSLLCEGIRMWVCGCCGVCCLGFPPCGSTPLANPDMVTHWLSLYRLYCMSLFHVFFF